MYHLFPFTCIKVILFDNTRGVANRNAVSRDTFGNNRPSCYNTVFTYSNPRR